MTNGQLERVLLCVVESGQDLDREIRTMELRILLFVLLDRLGVRLLVPKSISHTKRIPQPTGIDPTRR